MKKSLILPLILIVSVLTLSIGAYAAGTSTSTTAQAKAVTNVKTDSQARTLMKSRISSKLDSARGRYLSAKAGGTRTAYSSVSAKAVAEDITDESCLSLSEEKQGSCRKLYADSATCYEKTGRERAACLREKSGFSQRQGLSETSQDTKKRYAVLLLYHLQDKVENNFFEGKMTNEEASELITKIVEIKQMIMDGKSKAEIKAEIQNLRGMWKE